MLYKSSKRPAPFVEERNAKLQSELWENHAKNVSVEKQPPEVFCKKAGLRNLAIFTRKCLGWSFFLIKLQAFRPAILLKRDSNIGVFLKILGFFKSRGLLLYIKRNSNTGVFLSVLRFFKNTYFDEDLRTATSTC